MKNNIVELWKPVENFDIYEVSTFGNVRSLKRGVKQMKPYTGRYTKVLLPYYINGKRKTFCFGVHRLVAMAFIPNPENKPMVNHINGIKTDNRVENLEWCTASENAIHAISTGLRSGLKLTKHDVLEIRRIFSENKMSQSKIAKLFKLNRCSVSQIVNGNRWSHV